LSSNNYNKSDKHSLDNLETKKERKIKEFANIDKKLNVINENIFKVQKYIKNYNIDTNSNLNNLDEKVIENIFKVINLIHSLEKNNFTFNYKENETHAEIVTQCLDDAQPNINIATDKESFNQLLENLHIITLNTNHIIESNNE